jgi:hypothetical protein
MKKQLFKTSAIFLAILTIFVYMVTPSIAMTTPQKFIYGNTNGNILNNGWHTIQGDWIYYHDFNNNHQIFKVKKDGTSRTPFPIYGALSLNVVGDWMYYNVGDGTGLIYKIRTDGKFKTSLRIRAETITVVNNWIYFDNLDDKGKLYKLSTDGKKKVKISNDVVTSINVVGDWIYYSNVNDNCKIYKIRTDGKFRTKVNNDYSPQLLVSGDWIYYEGKEKGESHLYKIKTNGTNRTKISNDHPGAMNIEGNSIYYSNISDYRALYKINKDGSGRKKLVDNSSVATLEIINGWIYYNDGFANHYKIHKVKLDGTENQLVGSTPISIQKPVKEEPRPLLFVNSKGVPEKYGRPFFKYGVLYVPLAYPVISMGDNYKWDKEREVVTITKKDGINVSMELEDEYPYIYGKGISDFIQVKMSDLHFNNSSDAVPTAVIINNIVYVPYDFFSKIMYYNVEVKQVDNTYQINITSIKE